jgi:hypothetical protein
MKRKPLDDPRPLRIHFNMGGGVRTSRELGWAAAGKRMEKVHYNACFEEILVESAL